MCMYFNRIDKKLDGIVEHLKNTPCKNVSVDLDKEFLNYFPLKDLSTLKTLEVHLKTDETFKSKLVNIILTNLSKNILIFVNS